mgnify:CR=1 FL=1
MRGQKKPIKKSSQIEMTDVSSWVGDKHVPTPDPAAPVRPRTETSGEGKDLSAAQGAALAEQLSQYGL